MKRKLAIGVVSLLFLTACGVAVKNEDKQPPAPQQTSPVVKLADIDLTKIGHLAPKGRVQDYEYNHPVIIDQLLAHGKESIPYLISKLEDETEIDYKVVDYWYHCYVGDVALIILGDFFSDSTEERSTIPGVAWDEFLERRNRTDITGEELLRNYIDRHGRKGIKTKWEKIFAEYGSKIYWDEKERCFRPTNLQ